MDFSVDNNEPTSGTAGRIVLFGEFGSSNFGNDASLAAILGWLDGATGKQILSITRGPELVSAQYGIPSVSMHADRDRLRWLPRSVRGAAGKIIDLIRTAVIIKPDDVVIVPGSGVFEQKLAGPPWGLGLNLLSLSAATRVRRAYLAFVGVGAAHDTRQIVRAMTRTTLRSAGLLTLRDDQSKEALRLTGIRVAGCPVVPDIVLSEPMMRPARPAHPDAFNVGVGVIRYYDRDDPDHGETVAARYESAVIGFCQWLIEHGHRVELLIGDAMDEPVAQKVLQSVRGASPEYCAKIHFEPVTGYNDLLVRFQKLDLIVGSRYHNLIFGLINGLPVISVSYARKCAVLVDAAGLGRYSVTLETADATRLIERFTELVGELGDARAAVAEYQRRVSEKSAEHREQLLGFVREPRQTPAVVEQPASR